MGEISCDLAERSANTASGALADASLEDLLEPVQGAVVDCLCHVESEVEAGMVASSECDHELSLLVLGFQDSHLRVLPLEDIGVDESGLVP